MAIIIRTITTGSVGISLLVPGFDPTKGLVTIPASTTLDLFTVLTEDQLEAIQPLLNEFVTVGQLTVTATVDTATFSPVSVSSIGPSGAIQSSDGSGGFLGDSNLLWDGAGNITITNANQIVMALCANIGSDIQFNDSTNSFGYAGIGVVNIGSPNSGNSKLQIVVNTNPGPEQDWTFSHDGSTTFPGVLNVGTSDPSAILALGSTTQGFLPPTLTTTQKNAIVSPVEGLVIYDTTLHKLCVWTASAWETVTSV